MKELEQRILTHLQERGWDKLRPSDLAKSIMIEGAELLELFQWENKELDEVRNDPEKLAAIKKELADVMIYAIEMSVLLGLDTKRFIHDKLDHVAKKYPAELMRKIANGGSGSGSDSEYWKIKSEYRKRGEQ
ncbi:nucleotide pyrophosphohydrolase [Candidatus Uhrbacteria bacterium]|nr:nucleotide pyrophosphohydrolase [Candidatus Uhrbacteria bacterium]